MTYLWGGMILIGIIYGALAGNLQAVTEAVVDSSREAVNLSISMAGVIAMWSGIMKIAENAGLMEQLSHKMRPLLRFLFPALEPESKACEYISLNFLSNFLGLGWAATPAGLAAMKELTKVEEERREQAEIDVQEARKETLQDKWEVNQPGGELERIRRNQGAQNTRREQKTRKTWRSRSVKAMPRGVASNEMCTFLILNISSLQLIPMNIIAYRSQYGSVNPTGIVGPGIVATAVSTGVAMVFCKVMDRKRRA